MTPGGLTDAKPATPAIQQLADKVRPEIEAKENKSYPTFTAVEYRTQVVAGTNCFIKIDVGNGEYIHARIYEPLPCYNKQISLTKYLTGKKASDPLEYFE